MKILYGLLVFVVVAVLAEMLGWSPLLVFVFSGLAMVPLAGLMGEATEVLAEHTGPRIGGLLNATLGNAAELIITLVAIREGVVNPAVREQLMELVRASLTGSILGNILLVLGFSILLGGLKNGLQKFDRSHAGINSTMLLLAVAALVIPSIFGHTIDVVNHNAVEYLSLGVAGVMIVLYALSLVVQLRRTEGEPRAAHAPKAKAAKRFWPLPVALGVLLGATALIAWMSEILVGSVEHVIAQVGISEFFLGIIIIPIIGNVAEHLVAVQVARKNQMELSLAISVGSSLQIALFVAPLLVFVSLIMGNPLTLMFNQFELIALMAAVLIGGLVSLDGESNWLEGAMLLAIYVIIALAFFWLPT
jgi:Ca2+:H+ antiporter